MAGGQQPGGAVHHGTRVIAGVRGGFAGVERHADAERPRWSPLRLLQRELRRHGCPERLRRRGKDAPERVALGLEDVAAGRFDSVGCAVNTSSICSRSTSDCIVFASTPADFNSATAASMLSRRMRSCWTRAGPMASGICSHRAVLP